MKVVLLLLALASTAFAQDCCQVYSNATYVVSDPCVKDASECNATNVIAALNVSNCSASTELICCEYAETTYGLTSESCCTTVVGNDLCGYSNETITWTPPTTGSTTSSSPASDDTETTSFPLWLTLLLAIGIPIVCVCFFAALYAMAENRQNQY